MLAVLPTGACGSGAEQPAGCAKCTRCHAMQLLGTWPGLAARAASASSRALAWTVCRLLLVDNTCSTHMAQMDKA